MGARAESFIRVINIFSDVIKFSYIVALMRYHSSNRVDSQFFSLPGEGRINNALLLFPLPFPMCQRAYPIVNIQSLSATVLLIHRNCRRAL